MICKCFRPDRLGNAEIRFVGLNQVNSYKLGEANAIGLCPNGKIMQKMFLLIA